MTTTVPTVLQKIAADVTTRLTERKSARGVKELEKVVATSTRVPLDWAKVLRAHAFPSVIAEIKPASPSEGDLYPDVDPVVCAHEYMHDGAAALSVLTERDHFKGSLENLVKIREKYASYPLLMKDFIVDEFQLLEARATGADAVLLIVALLGAEKTHALHREARDLGLSVLVEVHDAGELETALDVGAQIVGVNNRDLKTLRVDLGTAERLARLMPATVTRVAESGLSKGADLRRLQEAGYDAFLIGSAFMKTRKPGHALKKLLDDARLGT